MQISSIVIKPQEVPTLLTLSNSHIPSKTYWDLAVNRALQKIRSDSALIKVPNKPSAKLVFTTETYLLFISLTIIKRSVLSPELRLYSHVVAE